MPVRKYPEDFAGRAALTVAGGRVQWCKESDNCAADWTGIYDVQRNDEKETAARTRGVYCDPEK